MDVSNDVSILKGVGPKLLEKLNKCGIFTIMDLLLYFPRDYEFLGNNVPVNEISNDEKNVLTCFCSVTIEDADIYCETLAASKTTNATPNVQYRIFLCIDRLIYHFFKYFIFLFPLISLYFSRFLLLQSISNSEKADTLFPVNVSALLLHFIMFGILLCRYIP